jgi:hypothetical protein
MDRIKLNVEGESDSPQVGTARWLLWAIVVTALVIIAMVVLTAPKWSVDLMVHMSK